MMVSFIDEHRRVYGVEPICAVLPIAPSTYYAYLRQRRDPASRAARVQRDEVPVIGLRWCTGCSRRGSDAQSRLNEAAPRQHFKPSVALSP